MRHSSERAGGGTAVTGSSGSDIPKVFRQWHHQSKNNFAVKSGECGRVDVVDIVVGYMDDDNPKTNTLIQTFQFHFYVHLNCVFTT
jgi:hypothetical protein